MAAALGDRRHVRLPEPDRLAVGRVRAGGGAAEVLRPRHVPLSQRRGAARRPPARLHRHRRAGALPADERPARDARARVRRVRPARGAVRDRFRPAPPGDHVGEHGRHAAAAAPAGAGARLPAGDRHHRRLVLPVDPVDLPADLQQLGGRADRAGPADRRPDRRVRVRGPACPRRCALGVSSGTGAARRDRRLPARLQLRGAGQLVPRPRHGAGQRGGHAGRAQRHRELPGVPAAAAAVDAADHGVR